MVTISGWKTEGLGTCTLASQGNTKGHNAIKLSRKVLEDNCDNLIDCAETFMQRPKKKS